MAWELINCEARECVMDKSKHYTVINYAGSGQVRCDIMTEDNDPVISFKGYFKDVRKYVVGYFDDQHIFISREHASYIGEELALADCLKEEYAQD